MSEFMTPDDLAAYLKLNRRTVYRMLEKNELPFAFKVGGSWRFKLTDVDEWIESQKVQSTSGNP